VWDIMQTLESKLRKEEFFGKLSRMNLSGILSVKERIAGREVEKPTGFIIDGLWIAVFVGPQDSVWVGMKHDKSGLETAKRIMDDLQLIPCDTYPYSLESPSEEIMKMWRKNKK